MLSLMSSFPIKIFGHAENVSKGQQSMEPIYHIIDSEEVRREYGADEGHTVLEACMFKYE